MNTNHLSNRFTKEYNCKYPFVAAGMAFFGTAELAIAVIKAGGIGSIGVGPLSPNKVCSMIREVKAAASGPLNVNFITFMTSEQHIRVCIEEQVEMVTFHWGHPSKKFVDLLKEAHIKVGQQVGSVEEGKKAVDNGVHLIIAQGLEAGGHNLSTLPTFVLVPEMVAAISPIPVLAAGGITNGKQVAAALCLGADGVWVGTRLVASREAFAHSAYKQKLVEAKGADTRLDSSFGPEWPFFNPMRLLENAHTREFHDKQHLFPKSTENEPVIGNMIYAGKEHTIRRFTNFLPVTGTEADLEQMPLLAGQGVGLIHEILPAGEIVHNMMTEAADTLRRLASTPATALL